MENRKHVKFLVPIFVLGLFIFQNNITFAYSINTHAYLTSEVVKFYNQSFPNSKISNELNDYLIDGSRREDDTPRWMNHFYDPVNNKGLTDSMLGNWQKSEDWAQDSGNQNKSTYKVPATIASILTAIQKKSISIITDETDFTWQRAIKFYVGGDKEKAMFILGHVLHLMEDVSVPEHTRNDIHVLNNPYENYTEQFSMYNPDSKLAQKLANKGPINSDNLNFYFDNLANYSNNNFYSAGTIGIQSGYDSPQPDYDTKIGKYLYPTKIDKEFGDYYLFRKSIPDFLISNQFDATLEPDIVLDNYWSHLSVKSIQYGAGVINLFFQEVEKAKNDPNFNTAEEKSVIAKAVEAVGNFMAQVGSTASGIISSANNFLTGLFNANDNFQQVEQVSLDQGDGEGQNTDKNNETQTTSQELTTVLNNSQQAKTSQISKTNQTVGAIESDKNEVVTEENKDILEAEQDLENKIEDNIRIAPAAASKQCSFNTSQIPSRTKIIINEVAWMGTSNSTSDEWIELKNISGGNVDINNWQLIDKDEQIKINLASIDGSKIIGPNKILLFERTDDNSVPGIKADLIYSGALSNTSEGLRLFDEQCSLIDEVLANPDWPSGNSGERKTMERDLSGLNWHTSGVVNGTPKAENSTATIQSPTQVTYSGGGGGASNSQNQQSAPAKILINEVQITGGTGKTENDFIEFYNPNNFQVNLNGYRLVKRTKTGVTDTGIKSWTSDVYIPANGYYLWANSGYIDIPVTPDITTTATISNDNGVTIRFGATDTGVIIDSVAWGEAQNAFIEGSVFPTNPGANQSIQRKYQNNSFIDTDNNSADFEIRNCSSPKTQSKSCDSGQSNQAPSAFFDYSPENPQVGETINFNAASSTDSDGQINSYEWSFGDGGTLISASSTASHIYSRFGSYQTDLIVFDNQGASSTPTTANIPVSILGADHIVISEILFDAQGSDEGKEFIELYNPTDNEINLTNYSLKILTGDATSTNSLVKFGSKPEDGLLIKSKSFFLVGLNNYNGSVTADIIRVSSLPNSSSTLYLFNSDGGEVDSVFYGSAVNDGQSLERKAWKDNTCALSQESGEFFGNACDSGSSGDFDARKIPNPQNSLSLPEPRIAPTKPENFSVQYVQNEMKLNFEWSGSRDYLGATSTLIYKIFDVSNTSATLPVAESTSTTAKIAISEIGRNYEFSIQAFDEDGFGSDAATSSISVPSFLSGLYFYQNSQGGEVLIDAYYGQYPFIPDLFNKGNTWKIVVFYLNSDAKNDLNNPSWQPNDLTDVLGLKYAQCAGGTGGNSLILPDINNCSGFPGGAVNRSFSFSQLEDNYFIVKTVKSGGELGLDRNDFMTAAFYSVSSIPTFDGLNPEFQLVATDKTKYYFGVEPERQVPIFGGEIVKSFDSVNSRLNLSWPKATDADTLDNILTYEVKYNNEDWGSAGNATGTSRFVSPDESFLISVRVKDDFNNYSTSTLLASWAYPPISFALVQGVSDGWSANFGERNTSNNASVANIQSVTPAGNLEFNKVVLKIKHLRDSGVSFNLKLSVFGDNGGRPDFNNLISVSTISGLSGDPQNRDLVFSFSPNIILNSGVKYWFVLENSSYTIHSYSDSLSNSWQGAVSGGDVYSGGESGRVTVMISGTESSFIDGSAEINFGADWYMKIGLGE